MSEKLTFENPAPPTVVRVFDVRRRRGAELATREINSMLEKGFVMGGNSWSPDGRFMSVTFYSQEAVKALGQLADLLRGEAPSSIHGFGFGGGSDLS